MNAFATEDLERLCSYIFPNEEDNFAECLVEDPEAFPGLSYEEVKELDTVEWGTPRYMDLLEKAAGCKANHHPYACAFRLHREFVEANANTIVNELGETRQICEVCGNILDQYDPHPTRCRYCSNAGPCIRCGHACPADGPCPTCGGDPMIPGDKLCIACQEATES